MVLDTSGSMGADVPDAGATKLDLAKQAVSESLGLMAPNGELGLWTFSTGQGEPDAQGRVAPWRQAVPVGPVKANLAPIRGAIDGLVADGGTGLYATLRAAQQAMLKDLDPSKINAIVLLTDGKNEYPADTDLDGLLRQLQGESVDTTVRVFPIAYGADADLATLRKIAEASSGAAYDAKDPASLQKVLVSVISNF